MKKLLFVFTAVLLISMLALAAGAEPVNYQTDSNKAFDVTYTGTAGKYYAVVVVEGISTGAPVVTESSIQFIDQKTAGADGKVSFNDILLKDDDTPCTVYIGGSDLDDAVLMGYVNNEEEKFTVSGSITSNSDAPSTVTLTSTEDATKVFTVQTSSGTYTVSVPADTYKFVVTRTAHLSYTQNELVVSDNVVKNAAIQGGDVTQDGEIGIEDLSTLLGAYNTATASSDITGEGTVDIIDLSILLGNYTALAVIE